MGSTSVVLSQGYCCEVKLTLGNIVDALWLLCKEIPGLLFIVDGFSQEQVKTIAGLGGYLMLATSCSSDGRMMILCNWLSPFCVNWDEVASRILLVSRKCLNLALMRRKGVGHVITTLVVVFGSSEKI